MAKPKKEPSTYSYTTHEEEFRLHHGPPLRKCGVCGAALEPETCKRDNDSVCPNQQEHEIADLQRQLREAQEERDRLRSTGLGNCYCDTLGETPCAYCQVAQVEAERDAAIERWHKDVGRAWRMINFRTACAEMDRAYWQSRAEAAERDAAEQRALAERLIGLLLQAYAEGKCTVAIKRFLREGKRLSPLGFPGDRSEYTLNVLLAEAQEKGD